MTKRKLFFILAPIVLMISTACEGYFFDPGMMDNPGGGFGVPSPGPGGPDIEPVTYTVTFDINGGTGTTPASQKGILLSKITLPGGNGFSKEGFYFAGWSNNAAGTGYLNYNAGESYTISSNTTLYAKWNSGSATNYNVTFNINGGSGTTPDTQTVASNFSITLPSGSGLSRDGYIFGGWNTNNSGTGTNYSAGATFYVISSNVTLYAKWMYTGVGGEENPILLTANVWKDDEITTSTTDRQLWYSFSVVQGTTYYVWWNDSFSGAGDGTKSLDVRVSGYYGNSTAIFSGVDSGWTTAQSFTASSTTTVKLCVYPYNSSSNGTFGIVYSANSTRPSTGATYTVTFNSNGGSGTVSSMPVIDGSAIILPSGSGLSRDDYIFGGWNTNNSGTGTNYNAGASYTVNNGNVTLFAKWNYTGPGSETDPLPLTADTWTDSYIISSTPGGEIWYSFDVTSGTTYNVWWNDKDEGPTPKDKTGDIDVIAYYSDKSAISGWTSTVDKGWTTAKSFTASKNDTVLVRVRLYNGSILYLGTFAIVYSTSSTRPE
jgi:uncharacterized repeat protein (TIGR02543 family)